MATNAVNPLHTAAIIPRPTPPDPPPTPPIRRRRNRPSAPPVAVCSIRPTHPPPRTLAPFFMVSRHIRRATLPSHCCNLPISSPPPLFNRHPHRTQESVTPTMPPSAKPRSNASACERCKRQKKLCIFPPGSQSCLRSCLQSNHQCSGPPHPNTAFSKAPPTCPLVDISNIPHHQAKPPPNPPKKINPITPSPISRKFHPTIPSLNPPPAKTPSSSTSTSEQLKHHFWSVRWAPPPALSDRWISPQRYVILLFIFLHHTEIIHLLFVQHHRQPCCHPSRVSKSKLR